MRKYHYHRRGIRLIHTHRVLENKMKKKICKILFVFFSVLFLNNTALAEDTIWKFQEVKVDGAKDCQTGLSMKISPVIEGDTTGMTYKYVWEKNNWSEWGVICDFTSENAIYWETESSGIYHLYVDVKDAEGNVISKYTQVEVLPAQYEFEGISSHLADNQKTNSDVCLEVELSGNTKNLEYKYVWEKDNWSNWGVIKDFSAEQAMIWKPESAGTYTIYVDIKDKEGNITTFTRRFVIEDYVWQIQSIVTDKESPQEKANLPISIYVNTAGEENLRYKYVWEKNNWSEWGVIQDFSTEPECIWNPETTGAYTIYVDVKDLSGKIVTKTISYTIEKNIWKYEGIDFSQSQEYLPGTEINILPIVSGNVQGFTYKYVWAKEDWSQWNVIQDFSENSACTWKVPTQKGDYYIYVDVRSEEGEIRTISNKITVTENGWEFTDVSWNGNVCKPVGETVSGEILIRGDMEGLQFKYVWMKNNWKQWGVLKEYGSEAAVIWMPEEAGDYTLYIDVMDQSGVVYGPYISNFSIYEYVGVGFSNQFVGLGESVEIFPELTGTCVEAEYKYVWAKDNWSQWEVIQDFSSEMKAIWTPTEEGTYDIYVDMRVDGQTVTTKIGQLTVGKSYLIKIKEIQEKYINTPYKWGGSNPSTGWDCSGFTQWALGYLGVSIPRTAALQAQGGIAINPFDMSQWQPGDVLCYYNTTTGRIGHAALYLGNGKLMHALNNRTGTIIHDVEYYERIDKETQIVTVRRYL